jgi:hypothetical protein
VTVETREITQERELLYIYEVEYLPNITIGFRSSIRILSYNCLFLLLKILSTCLKHQPDTLRILVDEFEKGYK